MEPKCQMLLNKINWIIQKSELIWENVYEFWKKLEDSKKLEKLYYYLLNIIYVEKNLSEIEKNKIKHKINKFINESKNIIQKHLKDWIKKTEELTKKNELIEINY